LRVRRESSRSLRRQSPPVAVPARTVSRLFRPSVNTGKVRIACAYRDCDLPALLIADITSSAVQISEYSSLRLLRDAK
jgi:hypothetical protein